VSLFVDFLRNNTQSVDSSIFDEVLQFTDVLIDFLLIQRLASTFPSLRIGRSKWRSDEGFFVLSKHIGKPLESE
jgi:hypothetical protein